MYRPILFSGKKKKIFFINDRKKNQYQQANTEKKKSEIAFNSFSSHQEFFLDQKQKTKNILQIPSY